ncbi:MAG: hypothetical protein ABSH32_22700 [Bryobacteraceae bacterium]
MTIQKVFAKAKAGGWNNRNLRFDGKNWRQWDGTEEEPLVFEDELFGKVFLDPSFWQSLGKALGWNDDYHPVRSKETNQLKNEIWDWRYHWHRFIDHLAGGGTAGQFFAEL